MALQSGWSPCSAHVWCCKCVYVETPGKRAQMSKSQIGQRPVQLCVWSQRCGQRCGSVGLLRPCLGGFRPLPGAGVCCCCQPGCVFLYSRAALDRVGRPGSSGQFSPVSQISVVVSFVDTNYCPLVGALGLEDGFGSRNFG